jgi:hypothetical protein
VHPLPVLKSKDVRLGVSSDRTTGGYVERGSVMSGVEDDFRQNQSALHLPSREGRLRAVVDLPSALSRVAGKRVLSNDLSTYQAHVICSGESPA